AGLFPAAGHWPAVSLKGTGFSPYINPAQLMRAGEDGFQRLRKNSSGEARSVRARLQSCRKNPKINEGLQPLRECSNYLSLARRLFARNPSIDPSLQQVQRQRPGIQHLVVEPPNVEFIPHRLPLPLPQ